MEPAILPIVRQRLIARIDDRSIELNPLINVVDDVIGSLAELEVDRLLARRHFEIKGQRICLTDPARPGINLAGGEKGEERAECGRGELRFASHKIILVTT